MDTFRELEKEANNWATEKGIFARGNPIAQAEKGIEEAHELKESVFALENNLETYVNSKGVKVNTREQIKDDIGDRLVTLLISAKFYHIDVLECLKGSIDVITKRKGKMINGSFVKDEK